MTNANPRLHTEALSLAYDQAPVVREVSLRFEDGAITTLIGPNGCGKSTLLRGLARLMKPSRGAAYLDGQMVHRLPTKEVAKHLGLLHQQSLPPDGITVEDLVRRGRYPHQSFLQPPSERDAIVVNHALELTGLSELRERQVDQLSGGQRQRAWLAMALAQETPLLLLDEPTTYLDVAHQIEVMQLIRRLNREEGRTIVMVLHDVNEAARASDRIVAIRDGTVLTSGSPTEVLQPETLREVFGIDCEVVLNSQGRSTCIPVSVHRAAFPDGHPPPHDCGIEARKITSGYGKTTILSDLEIRLPPGAITAIVGPNACGKSTLLRTIARLLKPRSGNVVLGGRDVHRGSHRSLARQMALLVQGPVAPSGFLVEDLIAEGRHPHQTLLRQWSRDDEAAVEAALNRTGLQELRHREVDLLSGGQRQRAWIGMALAQDTPVLLLDEPTTFLDMAHQVEVLDLVRELNAREHRTVVMVMHDLNLSARYADYIVAMKDGRIVAAGAPEEILTRELVREVFSIDCEVVHDPTTGRPLILPLASFEPMPITEEIPA